MAGRSRLLSKRHLSAFADPIAPVRGSVLQPIRALLTAYRKQQQQRPLEIIGKQEEQQQQQQHSSSLVQIAGFARSVRIHSNIAFINLTDGSLPADLTLQAVLSKKASEQWSKDLSQGAGLELLGRLQKSKGPEQPVEFAVEQFKVTGKSDASTYPLASSPSGSSPSATPSLLRKYAHLRPRDARHAAVLRTRNAMEKSMSDYFWDQDFTRVAAPIITSSDCEGGGEVFGVEMAEGRREEREGAGRTPTSEASFWNHSPAYLTVSSQLHLEAIALGLGRVYTVGPSFRAESSATNRHLAEFWMCEGEMVTPSEAGEGLEQVMATVEGLIKRMIRVSLGCGEAEYLWSESPNGLEELKQQSSDSATWPRMTYAQAIEAVQASREPFGTPSPQWGEALQSEHERWLAKDGPVFITHYPASLKPFYMRLDEGDQTVACFDLLVPRIGELVGGSLREERKAVLAKRMSSLPSSPELEWYVGDLRAYGCNPHGGFGVGMERLLGFITKTDNLRDCLTFPRVKGPLRF